MEVRLLGPLEVVGAAGTTLAVPGARQRTLLALLALQPGHAVSASRLVDDLWGDRPPQEPANALQVVVAKLRRALGSDAVATTPPGYALAVASDAVDAQRFEALVRVGRVALDDGSPVDADQALAAALALWRGPALVEFGDVAVLQAAASRWEEQRAATVEDWFGARLALGRHAELVAELEAAVADAPFRERLRGQLMTALYRSGRQAEALAAFQDARRVLGEELGLEPGAELRRLEAAILAQDPDLDLAAPPPEPRPAPAPRASNIRAPLTSFIGREVDLVGVGALLEAHRLVSIVGAGGAGKTRLAVELARRHDDRFPDGVWLAPLDAIASGDQVAGAVAAALGLSTADTAVEPALARGDGIERVQLFLADRVALVVLDNCEHVIDAAAGLAEELLGSAPHVRILATSREALRVPGEVVWPVPPLAPADAVTLFAERARAAATDFALDDANRELVAELCERLDGMPLAIELAAARSRAFTVNQLSERLDDRFRLLTGGARTALPRQQTLRAVADWSYDLLFADERKVFERLSVFTNGCTLEGAEAVCADDELPADAGADIVGRLADKSLVIADGSGRYRLLQTLAHYGRERLAGRD
ncbi:MAG TPA: BTAD domain-containing putative transcriptional regulator, partial [Acidimicrobiales bacterium]